jgi:integrase/recombinase XerC
MHLRDTPSKSKGRCTRSSTVANSSPDARRRLAAESRDDDDWPGADTRALFLTSAAAASRSKARPTSSRRSRPPRASRTTTSPRTSCARPFATRLVRGRTDLVIVAELLGHARLQTTRAYSRPTQQDAIDALELLQVDR